MSHDNVEVTRPSTARKVAAFTVGEDRQLEVVLAGCTCVAEVDENMAVERSIVRKSDVASDLAPRNEFTKEAFELGRVEERRVKHHDFSRMRESHLLLG